MNAPEKRVLVCRTDRLGDCLLSFPAMLNARSPHTRFVAVVSNSLAEFAEHCLTPYEIEVIDRSRACSMDWNMDCAVFLNHDPELLRRAFFQRVPLRVGNFSKVESFLWLNQGKRQQRSLAKLNESEYCGELLAIAKKALLGVSQHNAAYTPFSIPVHKAGAQEALRALDSQFGNTDEPFFVIHPGMGGSALNCSPARYVSVIQQLQALRLNLAITVGSSRNDVSMRAALAKAIPELKFFTDLSLFGLQELFRRAEFVLAPSTGPLHLAHGVGTRTFGLFSPVRTHQPQRWQPMGGLGTSTVLVPSVSCPAINECLGAKCREYHCIDKLDIAEQIINSVTSPSSV